MAVRARSRRRAPEPWWLSLPTDELLDVRLCDLELSLEDSPLQPRVAQLHSDLERAGLAFRPHVWLSTDWFAPDGVPGFAVPFFLAHPRLARLEHRFMLQVEGGTKTWCARLLRHETAHALDTAYRIRRRKSWRECFGPASTPYRPSYVPDPNSRQYVHNLPDFYAQSHPLEDFAETFAVWLRPGNRWRARYASWPALRKLEYVDRLMEEIRAAKPVVRSRARPDSLPGLKLTLREYYQRKEAHYGREDLSVYDRDLERLFSSDPAYRSRRRAAAFLRERRTKLRRAVAPWTGQHPYVIDEVIRGMTLRCRDLGLRLVTSEARAAQGVAVVVALHATRIGRMRHREYFR